MSAQSKGTASSSSSPSEGPPAASKAKVKEQIKIIVEDLELVLGDLKDVAKELKEVRMRGCAGGPPVSPVWGERPTARRLGSGFPGALLPPPGLFCRFFTAGRATGVQAGHGAAPGRASGRAAGHRCAARRPGTGWSPVSRVPCAPGSSVLPSTARSLYSGTSHLRAPLGVSFFPGGASPERSLLGEEGVLWGAAGPAALSGSGLGRRRPGGGRRLRTDPAPAPASLTFRLRGAAPCWPPAAAAAAPLASRRR